MAVELCGICWRDDRCATAAAVLFWRQKTGDGEADSGRDNSSANLHPAYSIGCVWAANVALIANILVLPFVPLAMLLTFFTGVGAIFFPAISSIIGWPASVLLEYMTFIAQYFAALPWALSELTMAMWMAMMTYVMIAGFCLYVWRKTHYDLRDSNIIE